MIKKLLLIFIVISLLIGSPMGFFAEAKVTPTPTAKVSTVKKPVVKKVVPKKKVVAKKKLIKNPPLITLDNAPHSPKKVVVKKKTTVKKPIVALKKN